MSETQQEGSCAPVRCCVCRAVSAHLFIVIEQQSYWRCEMCDATFLDPAHWLAAADELEHYGHHENDENDYGYRKFLSRLTVPLLAKLSPQMEGLDLGCGPGPALVRMMRENGHEMALYDPFFFPDAEPLSRTYDFVTCSEVAEHFFNPAEEFDRIDLLLRPDGWLAVMTCFQTDDQRFSNWHYRKDPTHVVFYRAKTFQVIAHQRGWSCEVPAKDVVLMRKHELAS